MVSRFEIDPIQSWDTGEILVCADKDEAVVEGGGSQPGVVFAEALGQAGAVVRRRIGRWAKKVLQ